jgi:hypothetical protein
MIIDEAPKLEVNFSSDMLKYKMNDEIIYPPCRKCGAIHGMGVEVMATGKIEPIDLCCDCLFDFKLVPITVQISLNDLSEICTSEMGEVLRLNEDQIIRDLQEND